MRAAHRSLLQCVAVFKIQCHAEAFTYVSVSEYVCVPCAKSPICVCALVVL